MASWANGACGWHGTRNRPLAHMVTATHLGPPFHPRHGISHWFRHAHCGGAIRFSAAIDMCHGMRKVQQRGQHRWERRHVVVGHQPPARRPNAATVPCSISSPPLSTLAQQHGSCDEATLPARHTPFSATWPSLPSTDDACSPIALLPSPAVPDVTPASPHTPPRGQPGGPRSPAAACDR